LAKVPNLHLTKTAVGCASIEALQNRIARRVSRGEVRVPTRMRPKRGAELVGGALHWIVKHRIVARQQILRLDDRARSATVSMRRTKEPVGLVAGAPSAPPEPEYGIAWFPEPHRPRAPRSVRVPPGLSWAW
jgi:hypothetical protein